MDKRIKAILSGTQGVGKTTLLNKLEQNQELLSYLESIQGVLIKEVVRGLVKEKGIKINREKSHQSQMIILEAHYANALKYNAFFSDRGALDSFVYATYNYLAGQFSYEEHKKHRELFEATMPYYTHVFYLPIEFEAKDDGFRDIDEKYRNDLEKIYYSVFQKYNIEAVEIRGSVEEREKLILNGFKKTL